MCRCPVSPLLNWRTIPLICCTTCPSRRMVKCAVWSTNCSAVRLLSALAKST
ncbi:Uncharacterised protein [Vibrio cholerae]|nr:Uncharacterised protein [Vibrio cholerae]